MKTKLPERPLPEAHKHLMKIDWFRRFTFLERLQIFFGYNLVVLCRVKLPHAPGRFAPYVIAQTVPHHVAADSLEIKIRNELDTELRAWQQQPLGL